MKKDDYDRPRPAVFMLAGCGELWCTGRHGFCADCGVWHCDFNGCES